MIEELEVLPTLYILMRTDLESMNPGKAMAQASHASNAFIHENIQHPIESEDDYDHLICDWQNQTTQGFGTVIVLGVTEEEMKHTFRRAVGNDFVSGIVNDPTYPTREKFSFFGNFIDEFVGIFGFTLRRRISFSSVDTCGYVFGDRNDEKLQSILSDFHLHP